MSYLLEVFGRGLIAHMANAFSAMLGAGADETIEELERAAELEPDDLSLQIRTGGRYLRDEEPVAARQVFLDVLAKDKNNLSARLGLACAFDELNQIDVALEQMRIAQKIDPTDPAILFCLGYCHERSGNEEQAMAYYQDSLSVCPTLRNAYERLAAIHLKNGRIDVAIHQYAKLCELDPQQTDLHLTLANLMLRSGDYSGAIQRYEHALTLEPDNWSAHNDIATAYEESGLIREAIEHLHKMIENEADFADTRLRLGDLYARLGDDAASTAQYHRALEINPDYLEANVKLGTQHLRAGRHEEAARSFSSALEINDRLLSAYIGIGVAQHAQGRTDEALASFDMARNVEPNSSLLFSEVARMQLKASASAEADKFLTVESNEDQDPDDGPVHAPDLISRQIQRLHDTLARHPHHADLHYRLGLLLRNRGQIEDALHAFQKAVDINPCYMKALIKLGLAMKEMDKTEAAIEIFKKAVAMEPDFADIHYQLGLLFAQRHQFELAVEHFENAAEANPQNISFQANLALALQNMGLVDRANANWQVVCDLAPDSAEAAQARIEMAKNREAE